METEEKSQSPDVSATKGESKICGVCGDRALGYNFNAVTCESCKAFFRRNALKNKDFRCPFSGNCDITVVTRRFCQHCRLIKCLTIGMRKDFIMSEEDKVMKRQKIEQNRAKKRPSDSRGISSKVKREPSEIVSDQASSSPSATVSEDEVPLRRPRLWPDNVSEEPDAIRTVSPRASSTVDPSHLQMAEAYPSPTSAASMPSPSPPPDSATVAGSKTLEMLSEPNNNQVGIVSVITTPSASSPGPSLRSEQEPPGSRDLPLLSSLIINNQKPEERYRPQQKEIHAPPDLSDWMGRRQEEHCWSGSGPSREFYSRHDAAREILQDVQRIPIAPNSIESILSEAIKLEFEAYSSLAKSHQNSRELNDAERAKLNELIVANKALYEPLDDDISALVGVDSSFKNNTGQSPVLLDVINLTAIAIRRLIKTSKKINAFKNMCQEDQVALLKGGCTEMLILRSAMSYDPDNQSWKIPHTQDHLNVKVDVLKEARGNIYEEHQRFLRTFDPRWRTDENIMLILGAITLFTPDRPRVVHHDVIKLEQNTYYYLLRRYLESVYPGCEARSTFLKLIQKIAELHRLNDEHVRVYLDVNPRDVEPLLIEIFDLKPH
ncbi:nuclear hormone receptor HR96 [Anabrus simplex]|uniref:nuclear hormone receptor HR96 n=1 Tax=Anabrus simplex TaxID=316456 RepID=UPI0035A3CEA8